MSFQPSFNMKDLKAAVELLFHTYGERVREIRVSSRQFAAVQQLLPITVKLSMLPEASADDIICVSGESKREVAWVRPPVYIAGTMKLDSPDDLAVQERIKEKLKKLY
jgi:hypothetical protein